jgi:uroporphyrinogen decarboxylase
MNSRERTFAALRFEEPDRVPIDFWASNGFRRKLRDELGLGFDAFLDRHDVDLRYIDGPGYKGPELRRREDGAQADIWGVWRKTVQTATNGSSESYKEVIASPLATAQSVADLDAYTHWPSPDWFDYTVIEQQCDAVRRRGRVAVFMGDRLNRIAQLKPAMYLRGTEQILLDLHIAPKLAHALFQRIQRFYLVYAERVLEAANGKLDILLTGDDFGSQHGPLMSPGMWETFLGNGFAAYATLAKRYGVRLMHHTCGSVRELIPLMIERGTDILQSIQPEAQGMDAGGLKEEFGNKLAFHGGISIQRTMPFGTAADVHAEALSTLATLAPGGGYIACSSHNLQADVPVANAQALLDAYHAFRCNNGVITS